jgi:5S rRNA maturation endonuclease (ribonuclease M5)/energy-coupling factor transporter ATP-binding protein EcfA2
VNYDRDHLLASYPLLEYLQSQNVELHKSGSSLVTNRCPKLLHREHHDCVSITPHRQVWCCHDCDIGGSVLDWIAIGSGRQVGEVIKELSEQIFQKSNPRQIVATYDYTDESGKLLFQSVRFIPKDFRQRQPDGKGGWKWHLDGITRVLFGLPKILAAQRVLIVEGEKDCLTLEEAGFVATTNCGGAKGWLSAYADSLKGKDLILIPDSDEAGEKHCALVLESVKEKAASVKKISLPKPYKDATDFLSVFETKEQAREALENLISSAPHTIAPAPLYSIAEMEVAYRKFVRGKGEHSFDLGKFLPSLSRLNRALVPGELMLIIASTGVGKSCICQAIARAAHPLATLFFELELPLELVFERFVQMELGCRGYDVELDYQNEDAPLWEKFGNLRHILVCPESGLSTGQIETLIQKSELRFGRCPGLVIVDYIGLVRDPGRSRYEQVSAAAEQLKVIAKRTRSIIVMASQISRPPSRKESLEVGLFDAKESGSLENSAGLVLGCWRPEKEKLCLKILKNSKGMSGETITVNFNGSLMRISEEERKSEG